MKFPAISWVLAPLHVLALATSAKSFRDNPIIGNRRLNRLGLHVARISLAHRMAQARRARLKHLMSDADMAAFERDGFIVKREFLPPAAFAAVKREALTLAAPARETIQGDTVTRRIALDAAALARMPAVRHMLQMNGWRGPIAYAWSFASSPLLYIQVIFSRWRTGAPDPQTNLHADTFHPTVKAWFFLTDVTEDDGPFVYVAGSHRPSKRRLVWERRMSMKARREADFLTSRGSPRIAREELRSLRLGEPSVLAVPANTLVVADTSGFHARGLSSHPSTRIEIWAYGRRNPFLPWLGLSPLDLPLLRGRVVRLMWWSMDAAERLKLKRNPWRAVGTIRADAPPKV